MRLGVFGGTFDPIHYGHLAAAENARFYLGLDKVVFMPAAQPPHKPSQLITGAEHRLRMVQLAIADNPGFEVSTRELEREGPSYTVDTLTEIHRSRPGLDLYFLMGSDSLIEVRNWYRYSDIAALCHLVSMSRPGYGNQSVWAGLPPVVREKTVVLEVPGLEISSTEIKRRLLAGETVRYLVPPQVMGYIEEHRLYRGGDMDDNA